MVEHIVIIGGGIMGVCTAYYLSQDERVRCGKVAVTVVEANEIASGASGKAGGFLALDWHGPATASLARLSYELHARLAGEMEGRGGRGYGYRGVACWSAQVPFGGGDVWGVVDPILSQREEGRLGSLPSSAVGGGSSSSSSDGGSGGDEGGSDGGGASPAWLQSPNVKSLSAVTNDGSTAQLHPLLFTHTLWDDARAAGVRYLHGRPTSWDQDASALHLDTPTGPQTRPADTLVITAGPWSRHVCQLLLRCDIPVFDLPGHSILMRPAPPTTAPTTAPTAALPAHAVFAQTNTPGATQSTELFVRPDGLIYVAGENHGPPLPLGGTADVRPETPRVRRLVLACAAVSDALGRGSVEAQQLCYRPVTPHGAPLVGALQQTGSTRAFLAAGHGVWGITLGPGTGKVMAEMLLDGVARSADVSQLDPLRHVEPLRA